MDFTGCSEYWTSWDIQRLENEYLPGKWSKKGTSEMEVLINHKNLVKKVSLENKATIPCQLDVPYGVAEGEKFDIYGEKSLPKDAPVFVYVHGGKWQAMHRSISAMCVKPLYQAGVVSIIVGFDQASKIQLPAMIGEIQNAASVILKWAAERGSRCVVISGHCSGAHLVSMLLCDDNWVNKETNLGLLRAVVHMSGLYDLKPLIKLPALEVVQLETYAEGCSPIRNLNKLINNIEKIKCIKQWFLVAENEPTEFIRQSESYAHALKNLGFEDVYSEVVSSVDHFEIVEKLAEEDYTITRKLIKLMDI